MSSEPEDLPDELVAEYELQWQEPPSEAAPEEAEREANKVLGILREVRAEMAANERLRNEEYANADRWLSRRNDPLARRETFLTLYLEALAPFVEFFGKAKSRDLPRGQLGFRTQAERLEVVDPDAALLWAKKRGLPTKEVLQEAVPHKTLADVWKDSGKKVVPDGCRVVPAEEVFFAKPADVS